MKDLKTIAIFTFASEYTVLKHLLEQANLRFIFQNEMMVSVLPFHSNALGGIRLKVHVDDIKKGNKIIKDLKNNGDLNVV